MPNPRLGPGTSPGYRSAARRRSFVSSASTLPALELYRESFQPSTSLDQPYALIGVQVIAADTDEEALEFARPIGLNMMRLRRGMPGRLPTPKEAAEYPYSETERHFVDSWLANVVYGSRETVRNGLDELRERTGADELMITTTISDRQARLRSYELIAQAYRLPGAAMPADSRG